MTDPNDLFRLLRRFVAEHRCHERCSCETARDSVMALAEIDAALAAKVEWRASGPRRKRNHWHAKSPGGANLRVRLHDDPDDLDRVPHFTFDVTAGGHGYATKEEAMRAAGTRGGRGRRG